MGALAPPVQRHPFPETAGRPKGLNLLGTLARHPALTRAYHAFCGHILFASTLEPREREILILRVAAVRGATYEWTQHVLQGQDAGLDIDEIRRIGEGPEALTSAPLDQAMVRAVDELLADATVTDATWAALAAELDEQQLIDLVFTVGAYDVLAMALRTFGVELDDDLRRAASVEPVIKHLIIGSQDTETKHSLE